jgi:uncharacterized protein YjdB
MPQVKPWRWDRDEKRYHSNAQCGPGSAIREQRRRSGTHRPPWKSRSLAGLSTALLAALLAIGWACSDSPSGVVGIGHRSGFTNLRVQAKSVDLDITALITALGGDSDVLAFYDCRNGVTLDTTGGVKTFAIWSDARGNSGFGPDLVPVISGKKYEPKQAWAFGPAVFNNVDSIALQTASPSPLFDLSNDLTLVYYGVTQKASNGWGYFAIQSDSLNPPARGLGLANTNHTTVYGIGGASRSININTGVHTSGTGLASDTSRLVFLTNDGGNGASVQATVSDTAAGVGSGGTAPGAGSNYLTLGAFHMTPSGNTELGGSPVISNVILLARVATGLDQEEITCWAIAKRSLVPYSGTMNCPNTMKAVPTSASITTMGGTTPLTDTVFNVAGAAMTDTNVVWSSSNLAVATVSKSGLVTAVSNGTDTITASAPTWNGFIKASISIITITNQNGLTATTVKVFPNPFSYWTKDVHQFTDTVYDQNGFAMTGQTVTWSSTNTAVATVSSTGLVTDLINGSDTIKATDGSLVGTSFVTFAPRSVTVYPSTYSAALPGTKQLTDTARDVSNNALTSGQIITWTSSNTAVATVSSTGLVTGVAAGTATITATDDGVRGTSSVTFTGTTPTTVKVFPATFTISTSGGTKQFIDTVYDQNNHPMLGQTVTWASSNTAVASINASGLARAVGNGTSTITATDGSINGTATLTVSGQGGGGNPHPNEPSGMTAVVDVGTLTVTPATVVGHTWTTGGNTPVTYELNNGTASPIYPTLSSAGSGGDAQTSGYRTNWAPTDKDSTGEDVVDYFQVNPWSTNGTGWLYVTFWEHVMPGATYNNLQAGDGFKIIKVENNAPGANPIMDITPPGLSFIGWGPLFGLQTSGAYKGNLQGTLNPNFSPNENGFSDGVWTQVEMTIKPNSSPGSTDGAMYLYVGGTLQNSITGICIFPTGTPTPFQWTRLDHYISRSGHAPGSDVEAAMHQDIDKIYISVK